MALAELRLGSGDLGREAVNSRANIRAYLAELVGTMVFVFISTGAVISAVGSQAADALIIIALAHGLGIGLMIYAIGHISGGHLNPAVSLGMIVTKRIKILPGLCYMAAQFAGAILATALLYLILENSVGNASDFGAHRISSAVSGNGGAFVLEAILTAVLLIVIFATAVSKNGAGKLAPLIIGLTITAIQLVALPLTGASVNPARTFGPALLSNAFDSVWVYMLAPAVGGVAGAVLYWFVLRETEAEEPESEEPPAEEPPAEEPPSEEPQSE